MSKEILHFINKLILWIKRNFRLIAIWLILFSIFVLFENKISNLLSNYILIGESEINSNKFNTIFQLLTNLILTLFFWFFISNYRLAKQLNFWILLIAVFYWVLRYNTADKIEFLKSDGNLGMSYFADIFLLTAIFVIILFIRNLFKHFENYEYLKSYISKLLYFQDNQVNSEYKEDIPINGSESIDNDKMVEELRHLIDDLQPSNAFVIGVNAEWGHGKTSFLKRLEYRIKYSEERNRPTEIVFWFNAWQHQDEKLIINNFFNQLKKELSKYSGDATTSINGYLSKLFAVVERKYFSGINFLPENFLDNDSTIKDYYDNIENLISRINKKIIVFVDDLDRLNKEEIIEVLRILRNVANFKNTIFICGVDKEYVIKKGEFDNKYLDKIFNLELSLPKLHHNGLLIYLKELLNKSTFLSEKDKELLIYELNNLFDTDTEDENLFYSDVDDVLINEKDREQESINKYYSIPLSPNLFFETRRDVKRFYNNLITNIKILENIEDVVLSDYLIFRLLIFKYSWMLNSFQAKSINRWLGSKSTLKLEKDKIDFIEKANDLDSIDKLTIFTVLMYLFSNKLRSTEYSRRMNQRRYLPIYLNNNIYSQSFSYTSLLEALKDLKISELIENKITGRKNEDYLLNDIKSFILKEENLKSLDELEQAINIINEFLFNKVNNGELMYFLNLGESVDGFKELADEKAFSRIDNRFGRFLRELNVYYRRHPNDISVNSDSTISGFLYRIDKVELSIFNSDYTKNKIISLFKNFSKNASKTDIPNIIIDCIGFYSTIFDFRLHYEEIIIIYKEHLKKNFKDYFIKDSPQEVVDYFGVIFVGSFFAGKEERKKLIFQAEELIRNKTSWHESDLKTKDLIDDGWLNFIDFIDDISKISNLDKNELENVKNLVNYLNNFKLSNYKYPRKTIFNKTNSKEKRKQS